MLAYSQPITPAPTTASVRGSRSSWRMSSLVKICLPSNGMCGSRVVSVPAAMTILRALTSREAPPVSELRRIRVGTGKRSRCDQQLDVVANQLMADDVDLVLDHLVGAEDQVQTVMCCLTV